MGGGGAGGGGHADEDSRADGNEEPLPVTFGGKAPRAQAKCRHRPSLTFVSFVGTPEPFGKISPGRKFLAAHESPRVIANPQSGGTLQADRHRVEPRVSTLCRCF